MPALQLASPTTRGADRASGWGLGTGDWTRFGAGAGPAPNRVVAIWSRLVYRSSRLNPSAVMIVRTLSNSASVVSATLSHE